MSEIMTPEEAFAYNGPDRVVHFTEYLLLNVGKGKGSQQFRSAYPVFEEKMGGIQTGEVVVISGYRKEGKTLFAESWIRSMMQTNPLLKVAMLSYEVQPDKLLAKYVSTPEQAIYLPLTLEAMDFDWLVRRCREAKYKHNCKVIMIDHLHFMIDMATQQNMALNIGGFMRRLKFDIALGLNLAVILIAHQGQPKDGREADMDSLRDSSSIAQESDATIIVGRRENFNAVDLKDISLKQGAEMVARLRAPDGSNPEDKFSAQLAMVKIDCHRRTGTYRWKKLFQKRGEFLEEV